MPYKDPEKKRARDKAYQKENAAKIAAYNREWQIRNRESVYARHRAYYRADPEKHCARTGKNAKANRERTREYCQRWRESNKEKANELHREWVRNNPEKYKEAVRLGNLRKRSARGKVTNKQLEGRIALYGGMCSWCGEKTYEHIDHVIALASGGTNWPANLRPSCRRCNQKKNKHDWSKRKPVFP